MPDSTSNGKRTVSQVQISVMLTKATRITFLILERVSALEGSSLDDIAREIFKFEFGTV
jgi:hypothetical protein